LNLKIALLVFSKHSSFALSLEEIKNNDKSIVIKINWEFIVNLKKNLVDAKVFNDKIFIVKIRYFNYK